MTLNASGPLSIGGCTTGQSIAKELGLTTTATHSLNCSSYRTLSGQPSGAVSMNAFHGKSNASYMCITTSGACVSVSGNYKIARWNGSGSFTVNSLGSGVGNPGSHINYVVVAGGGSGRTSGQVNGGGGAGGVLNDCGNICSSGGTAVSARTYSVSVGGGGTGSNPAYSCARGASSYIACIATSGGGGAAVSYGGYGSRGNPYVNGGSGGGGFSYPNGYYNPGNGTYPQGNAGGAGVLNCSICPCSGGGYQYFVGGGGGGACAAGCYGCYGNSHGGNGGRGRTISFLGSTYGGGGGGAFYNYLAYGPLANRSAGGAGGGGTGGYCMYPPPGWHQFAGAAGTANTGGGAGGDVYGCGAAYGGSGFVAIRWRFQ